MPSVDRPDLDEFLSALNGFLEKQTTPQDPSYLRFLEIFCRSVGSSEGHLLKINTAGQLESVLAYGLPEGFTTDFNKAKETETKPCPLDHAFQKEEVVALVELKPGPLVPEWFLKLMTQYDYKSLVAVPLLGHNHPVGILCAYYHDFCLFDQGTLDRLMGIGRMVGAATEKSEVAGQAALNHVQDKTMDEFLHFLISKSFGKLDVFTKLKQMVMKAFSPGGLICGSLRMTNGALALTVVEGENVPTSLISRRLVLPPLLQKKLLSGKWVKNPTALPRAEWGELESIFPGASPHLLCEPLLWQGKMQGAVVVWRSDELDFSEQDQVLLQRLASISALALNCE